MDEDKDCLDRCVEYLLKCLQNKLALYFNNTTTRYGALAIFTTIFFSIIAIALALLGIFLALYATGDQMMTWWLWLLVAFILFGGLVGVMGGTITICLGLYWRRHQITEDPIVTEIREMRKENRADTERIINEIRQLRDDINTMKTNTHPQR